VGADVAERVERAARTGDRDLGALDLERRGVASATSSARPIVT
jgi:hypothetical protein